MLSDRVHRYLAVIVGGLAVLLVIALLTSGQAAAPVLAQVATPEPAARIAPLLPEQPISRFGLELPRFDLRHLGTGAMPAGIRADQLPAAYDWRAQTNASGQPIVPPVKNQSSLGTCWAFAAVGQLESKLALLNLGSFDLSEQSTANCPVDKRGGGNACEGGFVQYAYNWWAQAGTHLETQNPYTEPPACSTCPTEQPYGYTVTGWHYLTGNAVPEPAVLKAHLLKYGPLWVGVKTGNPVFGYNGVDPIVMPLQQFAWVNHAVLLIGWDDAKPHAAGQGVWIVQNSWGTDWGQNGVFEIAYGSGNLGMYASAITEVEAFDTNGELLSHDQNGGINSTGYGNLAAWMMVEYAPAKSSVCASQVELFTRDIAQDIDVYLYDDLVNDQPQTLLAQKLDSKTESAGYTSIKFDAPIPVAAGNQVYVVVRVQNQSYTYPIAYDNSVTASGFVNRISNSGSSWSDWAQALAIRLRMKSCGDLPTATPTTMPTNTPTPTATPSPTITPTPLPTPFPVANVCLNPSTVRAAAAIDQPFAAAGFADPANSRGLFAARPRQPELPTGLAAAARALERTVTLHKTGAVTRGLLDDPAPTPGLGFEAPPVQPPSVFGNVTLGGAPAVDSTIWIYPLDDNGDPVDNGVTGVGTEDDGRFGLLLTTGRYYLDFEPAAANGYVTVRHSVEITAPTTSIDLGEVVIPEGEHVLYGAVLRDGDPAAPLADILVYAYNAVTDQLVYMWTDAGGEYSLWVGAGIWEVAVFPDGVGDWVYAEPPQIVTIDASHDQVGLNFAVVTAEGFVTGKVLDPYGDPLALEEDYGDGVNYSVSLDLWDQQRSIYTFAYVDENGDYAIPVIEGEYDAEVWLGDETAVFYAGPRLAAVSFSGSDVAQEDVNVLQRSVTVRGHITRRDGSPARDIFVDIWQPDGAWQWTVTDEDGYYEDYVPPGQWLIKPDVPGYVAQMYAGETAAIKAVDGQVMTQDFGLENASGWLNGTVVDEAGNLITDVDAYAYLRRSDESSPFAMTPVRFGRFQMKAPLGPVQAGLYLAPNTPYSALAGGLTAHSDYALLSTNAAAIADLIPFERQAQVGAQLQTALPPIVLRRDDAALHGVVVDAQGAPVTGVNGRVLLIPTTGGRVSKESPINPATGVFSMTLASGNWEVSYELDTSFYRRGPIQPVVVAVVAQQTATASLQLVALDGVIAGQVVDPAGKGVPLAAVRIVGQPDASTLKGMSGQAADCTGQACRDETLLRADKDGKFTAYVPLADGQLYDVYASTQPCTAGTSLAECLVNAEKQSVAAASRVAAATAPQGIDPLELRLVLRAADYLLLGQAVSDAGVALAGASIFGWARDQQFIWAETDANGCFSAPVKQAGEFRLYVDWFDWDTSEWYSGSGTYTLSPVNAAAQTAVTNGALQATKRPRVPKPTLLKADTGRTAGYTLDDGTQLRIPAGALPTQNKAVNIAIEPSTKLPVSALYRPVGYGYRFTLYDDSTGKKLEQDLRGTAQITLRYTADDLGAFAASQLRPALRNGDTWLLADNYVVDTATYKVTVATRQLGEWALVAVTDVADQGTTGAIFLPFINR